MKPENMTIIRIWKEDTIKTQKEKEFVPVPITVSKN
jgi:hypothetical protein